MDFRKKKTPRRRNINSEFVKRAEQYPHTLQFYTVPPTENISLQEFEDFACERLKVLKIIETVGVKHIRGTDKYREAIDHEFQNLKKQNVSLRCLLNKKVPSGGLKDEISEDEIEARRKDHISHFILRLAYCKTEDLKRWFLAQEMDLFRLRFAQENSETIQTFLEINSLDYKPIPEDEKNNILNELVQSSRDPSHVVSNEKFYKVPFTEVLDLVKGRRVYLHRGFAYVPHSELVVIIITHYRALLSQQLSITSRAVPQMEEDERLLPMLKNISMRYFGEDYGSQKKKPAGVVTAEMVDGLAKQSMPLCMSQMHSSLRANHHLKHGGRQQYGLFLKGIGMSLEEAMRFWKTEFTKLMDGDKFDKQYTYNIRHNFGKEGKRADYTPYSCMKIITQNHPGPGDNHGCPFRHTDVDLLKQKLQGLKISKTGSDEITDYVRKGHYQLACGRYFELSHANKADEMDPGFSPNHPNQYFEESQKLLNGETTRKSQAKSSQGTPRIVRIQPASQNTPSQKFSKSEPPPTLAEEFDDFDMTAEDMEAAIQAAEQTQS